MTVVSFTTYIFAFSLGVFSVSFAAARLFYPVLWGLLPRQRGCNVISKSRRIIRDAVDYPIKVRMPSRWGFGGADLIVAADLEINVLVPRSTTTKCRACSDAETEVDVESASRSEVPSFQPLACPPVMFLRATTPQAPPDGMASTEGSDPSRAVVTVDSAAARDKLSPSPAKVPASPMFAPRPDGVESSLAYTESEIVWTTCPAIGAVARLPLSKQSTSAPSARPVPPTDSPELSSLPSSDGVKLLSFGSAAEVIPAPFHGSVVVEASPPPQVQCAVAAAKLDKYLADTSSGSPVLSAIGSPAARASSAAVGDDCSGVPNSEQGVSTKDLQRKSVGLTHDASKAYVTGVVSNTSCVFGTGGNELVATSVASSAPSQAPAESNAKSDFANRKMNREVPNAESPRAAAATSNASLSSTQSIEAAVTANNGDAQPLEMRDGKALDADTKKDARETLFGAETARAPISEHTRPLLGIPSLGFYPMAAGCQASDGSGGDGELDPDYVGVAADPVFEGVIDPIPFENIRHSKLNGKKVENREEVRQEGSKGEERADSGDGRGAGAGEEAGQVDAYSGIAKGALPSRMPQDRSSSNGMPTRKKLLSRALEALAPKVSALNAPEQTILKIPTQAAASEVSSDTSQVDQLRELKRALLMLSRMKRLASPRRTLLNIAHYLREEARRAESSGAVDPHDLRVFREELDREQRLIEMAAVRSVEAKVSGAAAGPRTPEDNQTEEPDMGSALAPVRAPTPAADVCVSSAGSGEVSMATSAAERDSGVASGGFSSGAASLPPGEEA